MEFVGFYLVLILIMSTFSYQLYSFDKKSAIKNQWRIKERTLLTSSIIFGAAGGLLAMYKLRHKNNKWYFKTVNIIALLVHLTIAVLIALGVI